MQQQITRRSSSNAGPERFILALALFVPLGVILVALAQFSTITLNPPSTLMYADMTGPVTTSRPAPSHAAPPPTLAPRPTATPVPPTPTAAAQPTPLAQATAPTKLSAPRTYTVKPGDELKQIAAQYGVSIWKIINTNDIPNPDSLRVGQVLQIPSD